MLLLPGPWHLICLQKIEFTDFAKVITCSVPKWTNPIYRPILVYCILLYTTETLYMLAIDPDYED